MVAIAFVGTIAREDGEETRQQVAIYAAELARFPPFAVAAALRAYRDSGERFRPALGDLISKASAARRAAEAEAREIAQVLAARVYREPSPEERRRVAARFRATLMAALAPKEGAA